MLVAYLLLAQSQDFFTARPSYFKVGQEDAFLMEQQQVIAGLKPLPSTVLTLYTREEKFYKDPIKIEREEDVVTGVGSGTTKVSQSTWSGKPCMLIHTQGDRPVSKSVKDGSMRHTMNFLLKKERNVFVTPEGKMLAETDAYYTKWGIYRATANFGKDELKVTWTDPDGKFVETSLNPADGMEAFDKEFVPMLDGKKVLLQEKSFIRIDPLTRGVKQFKAKVVGHFSGIVTGHKFNGSCVELTAGQEVQKAYVSDEGDLIQVDLPNGHFLLAINHE